MPGIVHFGVGGFHRSHQAAYLDDLARTGASRSWGIVGVATRSDRMTRALASQDCLYTLVERGVDGDTARVVGALRASLFAPESPGAVLSALTSPATKVVTMTITGDGYRAGSANDACFTPFEYIVEALRRRRRAGLPGFTVVSCDNVPDNGAVARRAVLDCARSRDELLAAWIESNVTFPSGVVDRITPQTTAEHRDLVAREFGVADRAPVVAEPFSQWILEDAFCDGRPPLEEVGVRFVTDSAPYELIKKRLLNGGHSALCYLGALAGHERTDDVMADPAFRGYVEAVLEDEIAPLLPAPAGVDLHGYVGALLRRFSNPRISDPLTRLCGRGSTKVPAYLLPSLADAIDRGRPHEHLTLALAGWFRYLAGRDDHGRPIDVQDAQLGRLQRVARTAGDDPRPLLSALGPFERLRHNAGFVRSLELTMRRLRLDGAAATIDRALAAPALAAA